jgi:predicted short-subunit dehydrogenase-like oxidoreductase (DUF2520 family)
VTEERSARARSPARAPRVAIVGVGKVGAALSRALRARGLEVVLWRARHLPSRPPSVDALVLCVRDAALEEVSQLLADRLGEPLPAVALHTAGALGPSALAALSKRGIAVAQAHPLLSFAGGRRGPSLEGAALVVQGDALAVRRARWLARQLGMRAVVGSFDPAVYHAAAALVANGAIALAALGAGLLAHQHLPTQPERLFAPLLRSVAEQLSLRGLPAALSGPVRRGDRATILRHVRVLERENPGLLPLYRELVASQLPLAAALGEARPDELAAIEEVLRALGPTGAGALAARGRNRASVPRRALSPARR